MLPVSRDDGHGHLNVSHTCNEHHVGGNVVMMCGDCAFLGKTEGQGICTGGKHLLVAAAEDYILEYVGPGGFIRVAFLRTSCRND
jgi:hypothetical protein